MNDFLGDLTVSLTPLDAAAAILFLACLIGSGLLVDKNPFGRPSTHGLMSRYRELWMQQMLTRQPRIFDATILSLLRQGTTFFASGCMIVLGGCIALLGRTDQLRDIAGAISPDLAAPTRVWEVKLFLLILLLVNAFLKFVWAHRLFGYCGVVMAAVPNDPDDIAAQPMAARAARLANTASRSFNDGLRSVYFALAALAWLFGAVPLIVASVLTTAILLRREFTSQSRAALIPD